jgi:hypothetical protein
MSIATSTERNPQIGRSEASSTERPAGDGCEGLGRMPSEQMEPASGKEEVKYG